MTLYEARDTVLRGVSWQYILSFFSVLVGAIFYIYIIHYFSSTVVGVFSLLSAITYLFTTCFSLGLATGIQHYISYHLGRGEEGTIKTLVNRLILMGTVMSLAALVSLLLLSPVFARFFFHTYKYLIFLQIITVQLFSSMLNTWLVAILYGLQSFKRGAMLGILNWGLSYGLIIPFLLVSYQPLNIIFAWILGSFIETALLLISIREKISKVKPVNLDKNEMRKIMTYSYPIFVAGLIGYGASYIDRFVVSYFLNLSQLGIYNFSLLIVNAFSILTGPFSVILLSRLSEFYSSGNPESFKLYSSKSVEILTAVYVPLALLVAALSSSLLLFLAKPQYLQGYLPITIILFISAITVYGGIYGITLQAIRKTRVFVISSAISLISNFFISILLIPRYGINGAAIGFSSTSVATFIMLYYYSRKYGTLVFDKKKMFKIYCSGLLMFFLVTIIQERLGYSIVRLFVFVAAGLAVYFFLIRVLGVFSEGDLDLFLSMIPGNFIRFKKFFRSLFV